jgi:polyisoprenyl-phosphate glycosyltransferase
MPKVSVVIPVYYNEGSLPVLYDQLSEVERALHGKGFELELIFVDDGSGDNSLKQLLNIKEERPATRVVKLTRNFGAVSASKTGMRFVTGDCFTILAADLQDPPELVLDMVERWQEGSKFVVCVRSSRSDPTLSKAFSWLYYRLVRLLVAPSYPLGGFDVALMDRALLPHFVESGKNAYTPLLAYWLGFQPTFLYYHRRERVHGNSRWTWGKRLKAAIDALLGFSVVPIRVISFVGLMVALTSFMYGLWMFANALLGRMEVRGFATMVTLLAFLQGLGLFMLGTLGEYLWRVFDEVNKRPETVIDEVY